MRRLAALLGAAVLLSPTSAFATWSQTWVSAVGGTNTVKSIAAGKEAWLEVPDTAGAIGDTSAWIQLLTEATVCVDTDVSQLDANGALVINLMRGIGTGSAEDETDSVIAATLNSGTPCAWDVTPGWYFFDVTTATDSDGRIHVRSNTLEPGWF